MSPGSGPLGYGQGLVFGIDDEYSQQARWFLVARIFADPVMRAGNFVEPLADLVDPGRLIVDLTANGAGEYVSVDERRGSMVMRGRLRARRIGHDNGHHAFSLDVR